MKIELAKEFEPKKIEEIMKSHLYTVAIEKLIFDSKDKNKKIMFIEGPPTMNGEPHAGHLRGRVFKDLWYRFNTLCGYKIVFNAGWDTQGLPVELQAEKELGLTKGKSEITDDAGIERLVSECKKIVLKYSKKWVEVDKQLGMSFNQEKAYWTYKDEFIEREWQFLKKAYENNILTEGYRVVAYCPSCQTSLSHAEVNQGYDEVTDPSLYYKVKLQDEEQFLIVWTTMPFTLVTDAMIGFNPEEDYVYVKVNDETWIVGKTRLEEFMKEVRVEKYSVLKSVKGRDLEGKKYIHPLLDQIPGLFELAKKSNYHTTVAEEFVDANTGSGIVHLSPANGEEDYEIATKRKIAVFNPINDEVKFTKEAGVYASLFVRDADEKITQALHEKNALVRLGKLKHKYPLCWRSHHKIVWLARREYFYMLDRLGDKAIKAAEAVEYFFEQPKNRFLEIIKERHPWCISRERFWGCPLPIWNCKNCGHTEQLFSRKDIAKTASELPDGQNFELHRPWIDRIVINCKKCKSKMQREEFVLDTWHNSGSAPYSSLTDQEYKDTIPAPFLTEGIDQTRGWAYTMLIENVILNNKPISPFKSFLFQGHVLDKNGNKMSKSLGNVIEASQLLEKYPVDLVRFYFMWKSSPIEPLNFDTEELMSRPYQVLSTLYHLHLYFKQNSDYDNFDPEEFLAMNFVDLNSADTWLLSKLQKLIDKVTQSNDKCRFHEAAKAIDEFIINSLSQIYIPIIRGEMVVEETSKERRFTIYNILRDVLRTLDLLLHPFCPFTSEYLYHTTISNKKNILLESWPKVNTKLIDDNIEEAFDLMKDVASVSAAARMKGKLKRRWPLEEAIIFLSKNEEDKFKRVQAFALSQLNVRKYRIIELEHHEGLNQLLEMKKFGVPIVPKMELDRKKIGPKAKQLVGDLLKQFEKIDSEIIINSLADNGTFTFNIENEKIVLDKDDFLIDFETTKEYVFAKRDRLIVIISIKRNRELMAEGLIKDLARRLQALRKERSYNPTDVLNIASILDLDEEALEMAKEKATELAFLVRVKEVNFTDSCSSYKDDDIDGQKIRISVE